MNQDILSGLAGIISLLGGEPELVQLVRDLNNPNLNEEETNKQISYYWTKHSHSVKKRLVNSGGQKVKIAPVN